MTVRRRRRKIQTRRRQVYKIKHYLATWSRVLVRLSLLSREIIVIELSRPRRRIISRIVQKIVTCRPERNISNISPIAGKRRFHNVMRPEWRSTAARRRIRYENRNFFFFFEIRFLCKTQNRQ